MEKIAEYLSSPRRLALAVVVASTAPLIAAYVAQYGFNLQPCQLCYYQRVPYFINMALGLAVFGASLRYPRLPRVLVKIAAAVFLAGAALALFHAGVEYKWWPGLPSCSGQILPENASLEDIRRVLTSQPIVRCDAAAWTMFGISMAGYNFLLSLALGGGFLWILKKKPA